MFIESPNLLSSLSEINCNKINCSSESDPDSEIKDRSIDSFAHSSILNPDSTDFGVTPLLFELMEIDVVVEINESKK